MTSYKPALFEARSRACFIRALFGSMFLVATFLSPFSAYGGNRESARDELKKMDIPFDADTFLDRIKQGDTGSVDLLLKAGMSPDTKEKSGGGRTGLIFSVVFGHLDITKLLLAHGADIHARDSVFHLTPFLWAAQEGETVTMKILAEAGSDVNDRGINEETALMLAAANGHVETVKTLLDLGAEVNAKNRFGATALYDAVRTLRPEVVEALLKKGADVKVKVNGVTALAKAKRMGRGDLVKMLQSAGARE
jgi:ankyrin repeat protein